MVSAQWVYSTFKEGLKAFIEEQQKMGCDLSKLSYREWTKGIKEIFFNKGSNEYKIYSSINAGEYLLDLVWAEEFKGCYRKLILGLECEWGREDHKGRLEDVEEDFYKLMDVKCIVKVIIYQIGRKEQSVKFRERFRQVLLNFESHVVDEEYLFIEFVNEFKDIHTNAFYFRIPCNGKITQVKFVDIV